MMEPLNPPEMGTIAKQMLTKTLRLRRGENLLVETWTHMLPWAQAIVLEARKLGLRTLVLYEDEATYWKSVEECKATDLGRASDPELAALAKTDGYIFLWGPEDRPRLNALPPEKVEALQAYNHRWYQVAEKAHLRGCRFELGRATAPAARLYGVPLGSWQQEIIEASLVDPAPMAREGVRLATRLRRGRELRIRHANGTDVTLQLAGRRPTVDDGVVDAADVRDGNNLTTLPAGAVYVALEERTASGRFLANRTSYLRKGAVTGGRWTFAEGRLTEFEYLSGGEGVQESFEKASPGKDRPGFLSIGMNPKVHRAPGLEDLERGTLLLGVGSNTFYGGKNRSNFQSWLGLAGAHVEVDGKTIVADGEVL
jgi:leucyl aminopeptidase (aminopeptidase T)